MKRILALLCVTALLVSLSGCIPFLEEKLGETPEKMSDGEKEREIMSTPDLAEYVQKRTVTITNQNANGESVGTGFFIDDEGTIVTSYHVIDSAEAIYAEISDGGKYEVTTIVDFNEMYDLAVLKVDYTDTGYLTLCKEDPRTGETVYAVGSSLGFLKGTFSDGIVSSASRYVGNISCLQTSAAISSGNSGGPLVNVYGEVVGINSFSYIRGDDLNLAVKVNELDRLTMDKNWNISQYREWYNKEVGRSYKIWNYSDSAWEPSKINTYQHVTGRSCICSTYNWEFLEKDPATFMKGGWDGNFTSWEYQNTTKGYNDAYGVYCYEYKVSEFDAYTEYLTRNGFVFMNSEDYSTGTSYYYLNEFSGYCMDIFVMKGEAYIVIEPYTV